MGDLAMIMYIILERFWYINKNLKKLTTLGTVDLSLFFYNHSFLFVCFDLFNL